MGLDPMIRATGRHLVVAVARWHSGQGVGLVIERSPVRLPAVPLPDSLGQLSISSLGGRKIDCPPAGCG